MRKEIITLIYKIKLLLRIVCDYILIKTEKIQGIDFTLEVGLKELRLTNERSVRYQTAGHFRLKRILSSMNICKVDSIIDVGCGKGKAMYVMSKFPFRKIGGVDISSELCNIAKRNMQRLNISISEVYNCDASDFVDFEKYNYIYFFNPFPSIVMRDVINNVKNSMKLIPRKLIIIYYNPQCHKEIVESGAFDCISSRWGFSVYESKHQDKIRQNPIKSDIKKQ